MKESFDIFNNLSNETPKFYESLLENYRSFQEKEESQKNMESKLSLIKPLFPYSLNDEHFLCKCCNTVPEIQIENLNKIFYKCKNQNYSGTLEDILNKNILYDDDEEYKNNLSNLLCPEHHKKFRYFCTECNKNICKDCLRKIDLHLDHNLIIFDKLYVEIFKKIENILEIVKINSTKNDIIINPSNLSIETKYIEAEYFIRLISIVYNDFIIFPNYILFQNIIKIEQFLNNFIFNKNNKKDIKDYNFKSQEEIYTLNSLNKNIEEGKCKQIISIEIKDMSNLTDITFICNAIE